MVAPLATQATPSPSPRQDAANTTGYPAEMIDAVCNRGFSWPCETALWISWMEMGRHYQPQAVNVHEVGGNNATGLFQIMLPWPHAGLFPPGMDPLNPYDNAAAAYQLWLASGGTFCRHWSYWGVC